MDKIRLEAERIVSRGNGYGVQCTDLLELSEEMREKVWKEIVKIGEEYDYESSIRY